MGYSSVAWRIEPVHKNGFSFHLLSCSSAGSVTLFFTEESAVCSNFNQIRNSCRGQKVHQISPWKWLNPALVSLCNKQSRRWQHTGSRLAKWCTKISCNWSRQNCPIKSLLGPLYMEHVLQRSWLLPVDWASNY